MIGKDLSDGDWVALLSGPHGGRGLRIRPYLDLYGGGPALHVKEVLQQLSRHVKVGLMLDFSSNITTG